MGLYDEVKTVSLIYDVGKTQQIHAKKSNFLRLQKYSDYNRQYVKLLEILGKRFFTNSTVKGIFDFFVPQSVYHRIKERSKNGVGH